MVARAQGVVAIVPLKALDRAKTRLAPHLGAAARRELVIWMFARVVAACQAARLVDGLLVVAGDDAGAALARSLGSQVLIERAPGLPAAMATADSATAGLPATLVVAADLPLARGVDLDEVCRAGTTGPRVVVTPTHDGGTAALLRRPAGVVATAYGPRSATVHLQAARAAGVAGVRLDVSALAHDVDTPAHLRAVLPLALAGDPSKLARG